MSRESTEEMEIDDVPLDASESENTGFHEIQIIEVDRNNFNQIWPYMLICIKSADFIGVDLELSGLGLNKFRSDDVGDRYQVIKNAAETRSILSLGITTMKLVQKNKGRRKKKLKYQAQVFNILTLSKIPFTVESDALQFLSRHSFDFNRLIQFGVEFQGENCPLRTLFREIFATSATFCLHNGLIDLTFIYRQLYGLPLPQTLDEFCHNLADLFPTDYLPLVDSKYLVEYQTITKRLPASYLEFVFRRFQGDNEIDRQNRRLHIEIEFPNTDGMMKCVQSAIERVDCSLQNMFPNHQVPTDLNGNMCGSFSFFGFCHARNRGACLKVHSVDYMLDLERYKEKRNSFRNKRKRETGKTVPEGTRNDEETAWMEQKYGENMKVKDFEEKLAMRRGVNGSHRAGVDAFMTTFSVIYQQKIALMQNDSIPEKYVNKLNLSGKQHPLLLQHRINLAPKQGKIADDHANVMQEINKKREYVRQNAQSANTV